MEYGASTRQSYGLGRPGLLQRGPALRTLCPCVQVRLLVAAVPDMNSSLLLIVAALSPHSLATLMAIQSVGAFSI